MSNWNQRYTVREFDTKVTVDSNHIAQLTETLGQVPQQLGRHPHGMWFVVGPDKQQFKDYLFEYVALCDGYLTTYLPSTEHFLQVKTAPLMFLGCVNKWLFDDNVSRRGIYERNIGLRAGVLMSEILKLGYDVSQIGCFEGLKDKDNKYTDELQRFNQKLFENFDQLLVKQQLSDKEQNNKIICIPKMMIMAGKGIPLTNRRWRWYNQEKNQLVFGGQKTQSYSTGVVQ